MLALVAAPLSACGDEDDSNGGPGEGGKADDLGVACTFDTPSPLGDTSEDLAEAAAGSVRASAASAEELTELEAAQLTAAVIHLGMADPYVALADVFPLSDDGEFDIIDLEIEGDPFIAADWISFFAGDNEVGVVFADGTTDVIAEISDGDVMHCE
ncbi:MAG TPA: hypothetical protein VMZ28_13495 [Kofleriaceae bacterium]|nr:hypothetical protein [Kofleriaceae bacterium]